MSIALFFTCASCLLPWIAYFLADWRLLCIATSTPLLLAIATPWLVPESARWLVSQGKVDEAVSIMKKFERINGTTVPDNVYKDFKVERVHFFFSKNAHYHLVSDVRSLCVCFFYNDFLSSKQDTCAKLQKEEETDKTYSVLDLFRTPRLRNITILLTIIWYENL